MPSPGLCVRDKPTSRIWSVSSRLSWVGPGGPPRFPGCLDCRTAVAGTQGIGGAWMTGWEAEGGPESGTGWVPPPPLRGCLQLAVAGTGWRARTGGRSHSGPAKGWGVYTCFLSQKAHWAVFCPVRPHRSPELNRRPQSKSLKRLNSKTRACGCGGRNR